MTEPATSTTTTESPESPESSESSESTVYSKVLRYDNTATDITSALSQLFGHLVQLATPTLKNFHGDLYYDALWLRDHATGTTFTFLWAYDENGTSIGVETADAVASYRRHARRITLTLDDSTIRMTMQKLRQSDRDDTT